jgi:hypothetical protein
MRLPGLIPAAGPSEAQVEAFLLANNNTGGPTVDAYVDAPATFAANYLGGAACTSPTTGPITESVTSSSIETAESLTAESRVSSSDDDTSSLMWLASGENKSQQSVVKLTESEVSAMVQAAISRWADAGLSAKSIAKLQSLTFEIADLPDGQLASATSSRIILDETAAGYGWFFDATPSDDNEFEVLVIDQELQATPASPAYGRVDLLSVLMRQLGSTVKSGKAKLQGPQAWLMESTIEPGTRRAPEFKKSDVARSTAPKSGKAAIASNKASVAQQPGWSPPCGRRDRRASWRPRAGASSRSSPRW